MFRAAVDNDQDSSSSESIILPQSKHRPSVNPFARQPHPVSSLFGSPSSNSNSRKKLSVEKPQGQGKNKGNTVDSVALRNGELRQSRETTIDHSSSEDVPLPSRRKSKKDVVVVDSSDSTASGERDELAASPIPSGRNLRSHTKGKNKGISTKFQHLCSNPLGLDTVYGIILGLKLILSEQINRFNLKLKG